MARGLRLTDPGAAWAALAALLAIGALGFWVAPAAPWDWQPALAATEPWRWWSAAFVHWSSLHLGANLAGALVVGALGWVGRVGAGAALGWLTAWPATHLLLLMRPELAHYGGLSGVLHAGVAVAAAWVALCGAPRTRAVGAAILVGLLVKVALEDPLGPPTRSVPDWDIAVAPIAHATGALAGLVAGGLAALVATMRR